jgi:hypothetical protein
MQMHKYTLRQRSSIAVGALLSLVMAQACAPDAALDSGSAAGYGGQAGTSSTPAAAGATNPGSGGAPGAAGTLGTAGGGGDATIGSTGGSSTGGNATGGGSTGGGSTGGSSTGGGSTGGGSTGGGSTGGGSTGGAVGSAGAAGGGATAGLFGQVSDLLGTKCAGGKCHGTGSTQAGFATAKGSALGTLLTTPLPASTPHCVGVTLVTANDANSPLLNVVASGGKISCTMPKTETFGPMPLGCTATATTPTGSCLTAAQIKVISDWIAAGAPQQ